MVKIGAELPKLSQNKTGYPFFGPPCTVTLGEITSARKDRPSPNNNTYVTKRKNTACWTWYQYYSNL